MNSELAFMLELEKPLLPLDDIFCPKWSFVVCTLDTVLIDDVNVKAVVVGKLASCFNIIVETGDVAVAPDVVIRIEDEPPDDN